METSATKSVFRDSDVLERLLSGSVDEQGRKLLTQLKLTRSRLTIGGKIVQINDSSNITINSSEPFFDQKLLKNTIKEISEQLKENENLKNLSAYIDAIDNFNSTPYKSLSLELDEQKIEDLYIPIKASSADFDVKLQHMEIGQILQSSLNKRGKISVLIKGDPGSGKTTLLYHVALNCWHNPEALGLSERYLPMYVKLQNLASVKGDSSGERLWEAVKYSQDFFIKRKPAEGYFEEWPELAKTKWLLLLDGFDEINEKNKDTMTIWLLKLMQKSDVHTIITTRPTMHMADKLSSKFDNFLITSFEDNDREELARKLLGDQALFFLNHLRQFELRNFSRTPLNITIAAIAFKKNNNALPDSLPDLYKVFIFDFCIKEAVIHNNLLEDVPFVHASANFIFDLLMQIAYENSLDADINIIETSSGQYSKIVTVTADLLSRLDTNRNPDAYLITGQAKTLLEKLGKGSGIFICSGNVFTWLHPSIREFLCAEYLLREAGVSIAEAPTIVLIPELLKWKHDRWAQVIVYLMIRLSETHDISKILKEMIRLECAERDVQNLFLFAAGIWKSGARLSDEARMYIFDGLTDIICFYCYENFCSRLLRVRNDVLSEVAREYVIPYKNEALYKPSMDKLKLRLKEYALNFIPRDDANSVIQSAVFMDLVYMGCSDTLMELAAMDSLLFGKRVAALYWTRNLDGFVEEYGLPENADISDLDTDNHSHTTQQMETIAIFCTLLYQAYGEDKKHICYLLESIKRMSSEFFMLSLLNYNFDTSILTRIPSLLSEGSKFRILMDEQFNINVRMESLLSLLKIQDDGFRSDIKIEMDFLKSFLKSIVVVSDAPEVDWEKDYLNAESAKAFIELFQDHLPDDMLLMIAGEEDISDYFKFNLIACAESLVLQDTLIKIARSSAYAQRVRIQAMLSLSKSFDKEEMTTEILQDVYQLIQQELNNCPSSIALLVAAATVTRLLGNDEASIYYLDKIIAIEEHFAWALNSKGCISYNNGDYKESIKLLSRSAEMLPNRTLYNIQLADAYFQDCNYERALEVIEKNSFYTIGYPEKRWVEVSCHIRRKDFHQAIKIADSYISRKPDSNLLYNKAIALSYQSFDLYSEALVNLQKAEDFGKTSQSSTFLRYLLNRKMKNHEQALISLDDYAKEATHSYEGYPVLFLRCALLIAKGQIKDAEQILQDIDNTSPFGNYYKAIILLNKSKEGEAKLSATNSCHFILEDVPLTDWLLRHDNFDLSGLLMNSLLGEDYVQANTIFDHMNTDRENFPYLMDYIYPATEELQLLAPNRTGLKIFYTGLVKALFPGYVKKEKAELNYQVSLPRQNYPIPMYCRETYIYGLYEEDVWSRFILSKYTKNNRAVLFFRIKEVNDKNDRIYGLCNFVYQQGDKHNLKFSERLETILEQNLDLFVNSFHASVFIFTESELSKIFKSKVDEKGLPVRCLLAK